MKVIIQNFNKTSYHHEHLYASTKIQICNHNHLVEVEMSRYIHKYFISLTIFKREKYKGT